WSRYRNPVELLLNVDNQRWEVLIDSDAFMNAYRRVVRSFDDYMDPERATWFARRAPEHRHGPVAYFSMEYGLHSSLGIYSGGLGVLSGDHLKTASDLGLPFVAMGLLYRSGYFRQAIDADGFQQHIYPEVDFSRLPLRPALDRRGRSLLVRVPMPVGQVAARVWLAQVGRVPLLLLDTDIPENDPSERPIANVLYVRGREMRLLQELVLGIGGVRALEALEIEPVVWHMNEGHSSLLQLERWMRGLEANEGSLEEVRQAVRRTTVFTTHTPVPAGNEQYDRVLARRYIEPWAERLGQDVDRLLDLGAADHGEPEQAFNLSAFALRESDYANGVSRLNAEVADGMWRHLFPDRAEDEPVIDAITNGIHLTTWLGRDMQDLFERHLGADWRERLLEEAAWDDLVALDETAVWEAHASQKQRLLHFVRTRARQQVGRHGRAPGELRALAERISEEALVVGFARRFATYKRAGLLFSDVHRLRKLVADPARPLQIFIAGKAHPADRPGQDLVRHIFQLSQEPGLRGRIVFLEDYDMEVAQRLVQGVDLWLNTPQRTREASGTSGMKAAINGVLNCSILDGWWPEAYDGQNGWAIGSQGEALDEWDQDPKDAATLYRLLEEEILPLYFERDDEDVPRAWAERMGHAVVSVGRRFVASRMVREYYERAYQPRLDAADEAVSLAADGGAGETGAG
ncbi:MAG: alpha-glucan family phosphorylase, partial [Thermoanaerobaculia bacterium]|nr:alpha-glucan family phosphorylase [Thermoanaerobaculia bacterium]